MDFHAFFVNFDNYLRCLFAFIVYLTLIAIPAAKLTILVARETGNKLNGSDIWWFDLIGVLLRLSTATVFIALSLMPIILFF